MKRKVNILLSSLLFLTLIGFNACKNKDLDVDSFKIERERVVPSATSVSITGSYSFTGNVYGMEINIGESESLIDASTYEMMVDGTEFAANIEGLKPGTQYYYCYSVDFGTNDDHLTETKSFTTLSTESPIVKALEVLKIDSTTFRIKCEVVADGGSEVTECGICYNTYGDPTMDDETMQYANGGLGIYTIRMEHLALGKRYYVRAYAKNAAGKIGWSDEVLDFETEAPLGASVDIELSCNPEEGGNVSGGGTFDVGTQCTAKAVANPGYTFINWTENSTQVSSDEEFTFTVERNRILVANFTRQAYVVQVQVDPENSGTVTGAGGYNHGEECTLTATASNGYDFVKWTKGGSTVSTSAEYSFTVNESAIYIAHFKIKNYTINVSSNPSNGGTVTGDGTFNFGESHTVHAEPASGFAFANWTDDGDVVSEDAHYTFTVTSNRSLVANFTELQSNEYSIMVSASPSNGGTVTGGGTYQQGQNCTVKATSKPNFTFVNWTENGNQVSDLAEYTFTVMDNRILVSNFEAQAPTEYTVSVSANPSNGGTVTGNGTYEQGEQCTVAAEANTGFIFVNWTENGNPVSTNARYTFIVNSNRNLVANFSQQSYTINASASPSNGGTVSGAGNYNHGQSCTLSATASGGYTFSNWTENGNVVSSNPNYTFTVTSNRILVAHFSVQAPNTYNINVSANPSNGGMVTGGGSYTQGASCTVTATNNTGYTFLRWTENGNQVSTNANYTFTVTNNRTLVAQFQVQSYTISVSANPTNGGTVSGGGNYNHGQQCTVTAVPSNGYTFLHWTENGNPVSTNANYTFTVTGNHSLVAQFQQQNYTISVSSNPSNGGTITGGGTYHYGDNCTVTATPSNGYTFLRWTENGNQVSTNASYQFTVTGSRNLVAQFQVQSYTINVSSNPTNGGSVGGGGAYTSGQSCTVTATPANGYTFVRWTENGNQVSTNANYTFTVTSNRTLVAQFQAQSYTISVSANPTNGGSVGGGGTYTSGQSCTVTATPTNGYTFIRWTENGNQVSTNANYTFTVTGDRTLVAQFQAQSYTISVSANPTNGGSVNGGGTYTSGQSCTVTATPANGYTFANWTENGNVVSSNANYTFTVNSNRTLVANFNGGTPPGPPTQTHWTFNVYTQYNMTCTAVLFLDGESMQNNSRSAYLEVGAFCGDECRGSYLATYINLPFAQGYFYQMQIYSDVQSGELITFRIWDHEVGAELNATCLSGITFVADDGLGNLMNPFGIMFVTNTGPSFIISTSANPSNGGTVSGGGTYNQGASCTVTATPANGYTFANWTENGNVVSSNANYTFTVNSNRNLVANFNGGTPPGPPTQTHWTYNVYTQYNMTLTGVLNLDGESMQNNSRSQYLEVGAFCGNECRGSFLATLNPAPFAQGYFYQMQIYSDVQSGELITFKVWDHEVGAELNATCLSDITFVADHGLGNLMSPYVLMFVTNTKPSFLKNKKQRICNPNQ